MYGLSMQQFRMLAISDSLREEGIATLVSFATEVMRFWEKGHSLDFVLTREDMGHVEKIMESFLFSGSRMYGARTIHACYNIILHTYRLHTMAYRSLPASATR